MRPLPTRSPVSIHAFRGEGDPRRPARGCGTDQFQSTPSGGKATEVTNVRDAGAVVSIHAFRGEGDVTLGIRRARQIVSIHAFRGEGDSMRISWPTRPGRFNPRLPGGRRRGERRRPPRVRRVSIHAFRGEGDDDGNDHNREYDVSIHAFRGEGDVAACRDIHVLRVSIHAFRGEGDSVIGVPQCASVSFQSTPSGGKATMVLFTHYLLSVFQSTPSGGKAT